MNALADRVERMRERVAAAAARAGRSAEEVTVVAVSKTFPPAVVRAAMEAGIGIFGENRAQELAQKAAAVGSGVSWHFVGHLQTNKVRQVVGVADLIHSVDRYGVAEAISARARRRGSVQKVLLEVNISGEASKFGIEPGRLLPFAREVAGLDHVRVCGLMTMAPLADDPEASRRWFAGLREAGEALASHLPDPVELSMGMTRDFEIAIEEGATIVRLGEAVFGKRAG